MKKLVAVLFGLILMFNVANGQQAPKLPGACEAFLPQSLLNADILEERVAESLLNDRKWGQGVDPGVGRRKYWIAYSDREDNDTYYTPSYGSNSYKTLGLGERVIIAKIDNGFALVYKEPRFGMQYPAISSEAECMGWVSMKKLLLWSSCLANDHGIYNKALLCLNLDNVQNRKNSLGIGLTNPDKKSTSDNGNYRVRLRTDMDFYFIMKRLPEEGLVLLAENSTFDGVSDAGLKFWVESASYIPWSQRSCIEPTWNIGDVEYFASNNTTAGIYVAPSKGERVSWINYRRNSGSSLDRYRMAPYTLRYPLLDGGTADMYKCSVFSASGTAANEVGDEGGEKNKMQMLALDTLSNIRMAIVIDGTSSMEKYYPAVKQAIKNACGYFSEQKYKIKVAVVIYRDYTDGEGLVEMCSWSDPDDPRLSSFIDNGGGYGIKSSSSDRTSSEALYYGVNYAVDNLNFNDAESNIILVVGDCGNDLEDTMTPVSNEELTSKLTDNKIHLLSFQVRNILNNSNYSNFNDQLCQMLKGNLDARFGSLRRGETARFIPNQEGFTFENEHSKLLMGEHKFNAGGGEMEPRVLTSLMEGSIRSLAVAIDYQMKVIQEGYIDTSMFISSEKTLQKLEMDNKFLEQMLGKEYMKIVERMNSLMTFAGYTPKKDPSGRAYYKPVVFISNEELNVLMDKLAPVDEAARMKTNDRKPYLDAMKALVRSMIPDISEQQMSQMGNQEIMSLANGLNESSDALKGYTLSDMADATKVDDRKYQQILDKFQNKYRKLRGIQQSKYKFSYKFKDATYYWIPIEDLP